jgi:hypothetical protein
MNGSPGSIESISGADKPIAADFLADTASGMWQKS